MELKDMGYKIEPPAGMAPEIAAAEEQIVYPSLMIDKHIPEALLKKELGKTFKLTVLAKLSHRSESEDENRDVQSVTLDVLKMGYHDSDEDQKVREDAAREKGKKIAEDMKKERS